MCQFQKMAVAGVNFIFCNGMDGKLRHNRVPSHNMKPLGILSILALFATFAVAEPPKLRLPTNIAPVRYRAELTLDPEKDSFSGTISIAVNVKQPLSEIWLNANRIAVEHVVVSANGHSIAAKPIPGARISWVSPWSRS